MILNKNSLLLISLILSQQGLAAETLEQTFAVAIANNQRIIAAQADS